MEEPEREYEPLEHADQEASTEEIGDHRTDLATDPRDPIPLLLGHVETNEVMDPLEFEQEEVGVDGQQHQKAEHAEHAPENPLHVPEHNLRLGEIRLLLVAGVPARDPHACEAPNGERRRCLLLLFGDGGWPIGTLGLRLFRRVAFDCALV